MTTQPDNPPKNPAFDTSPPLIVFDGVCVLCSGFVRMVVGLDRKSRFRFATAPSPLGEALFRQYGLRTDSYETNLALLDGAAFTWLDRFVAMMAEGGRQWRAAKSLLKGGCLASRRSPPGFHLSRYRGTPSFLGEPR